ncbi:hypothetical protein LAZ67_16001012 [Cordylochernes scorpioides]|uniref:Uncharacterized protein n=1 Tax=Cordylochernes scorpioides TaxID=51811 RepID=A0ABY6LD36_9ARAC|nr:hypothetical protein LAZ67_16001012 [Cordylochernes scorpioides]
MKSVPKGATCGSKGSEAADSPLSIGVSNTAYRLRLGCRLTIGVSNTDFSLGSPLSIGVSNTM